MCRPYFMGDLMVRTQIKKSTFVLQCAPPFENEGETNHLMRFLSDYV